MERKGKVGVVLIVFLILIAIAIFASVYIYDSEDDAGEIIGGDRDEFNCLISAGYSFDSSIGACTRSWEVVSVDDKRAAEIAVDFLDRKGITVVSVLNKECTGCFEVVLDDNMKRININLKDWDVLEEYVLSIAECTSLGGRVVVGALGCGESEEEIGCVDGCVTDSICCVND